MNGSQHWRIANLVIAIIALLIGIVGLPAALAYIFDQSVVIAILTGVLVGVIVIGTVAGSLWVRWHLNRPPYTLVEGEVELRFRDPEGSRVSVTRTEKISVNQRELGYIRIGRIFSDGSIQNIRVDNKPIGENPRVRQEIESGALYLVKDFHPPLMRDQTEDTTLSFDVVEGYKMNPAGLNQNVASETKRLRIKVHFHPQRICRSAQAYLRYSGLPHKQLPDPDVSNDGMRLTYDINRPKRGEEYRVQWHW